MRALRILSDHPPSVSVIVPAHQAAGEIDACLNGLFHAGFSRDEIVVVDDGSSDRTGEITRGHGLRVLRHERAKGPAKARNAGVAAVRGDIIVFVDADVVLGGAARSRIVDHFRQKPELKALFGSYDDRPPRVGTASFYRNMLHHFVHQRSDENASTFWTGIGAVRRDDFLRLGGFDKAWENIEDVAFGMRLQAAGGRILLDKGLLGKHLKVWTVRSMFKTDLIGRAIPWSRLLLFHGGPRNDLNFTVAHRVSLLMVALMGMSVFLIPFQPAFGVVFVMALAGFVWANRTFLALIKDRGGIGVAILSCGCHVLHYLAGGLGLLWVLTVDCVPRLWGQAMKDEKRMPDAASERGQALEEQRRDR